MDAVELPYPVDVAVPSKLMRSEGFGGTRVTVKEVDQDCERSRVSVFMNSSVERCSTLIKQKGGIVAATFRDTFFFFILTGLFFLASALTFCFILVLMLRPSFGHYLSPYARNGRM